MSFLNLSSVRPDKHKDRIRWNASWEGDLEIYQTFKHGLPNLYLRNPNLMAHDTGFGRIIIDQLNASRRTELIALQDDVSRRALARIATDGFSDKWIALETDIRKQHLLEAIFKTSTTGPDMEDYRKWCPEITLEGLGNDGQAYLDLLIHLIRSESYTAGERDLIMFPHPIVDAIFLNIGQLQGPEFYLKMQIDRTYFITMVIWRTYLSFHDLDEIPRFFEVKPLDSKNEPITRRSMRGQLREKSESKKEFAERLRKMKEMDNAKGESVYCWHCGLSEAALPPGTSLKACSGCKKIGRKVLYCSTICQKEDWKEGLGEVPHKLICGEPKAKGVAISKTEIPRMPVEPIIQDLPSQMNTIHKRTPALTYQLSLLRKHWDDNNDYFFVQKHPLPDISLRIPVRDIKAKFLAHRKAAFETNDASAVKKMYTILQPFASRFTPPTYSLKKQLEDEYGKFEGIDDGDETEDADMTKVIDDFLRLMPTNIK